MEHRTNVKEATMVNGVNLDALGETIHALRDDPSLGEFQFRARNKWVGGTHNRSTIKEFYGAGKEDAERTRAFRFDADEPPVLLGRDQGANPVEYILHALAGCMTTTMVAHAAARGFTIESLESQLEGDIDVRGFLGIADDVSKGFRDIRVTFRVKSDAPAAVLRELAENSPVYNTITKPVRVTVNVEKVS
ncbi:MAG TPA: osmotically inducible protein C [Planctomycetes bacterium]|nr:osmotically inducible protein C [Planctomycetota bacterium]